MNYPTVYPAANSHQLNFVGKKEKAIEITIHSPSDYIQKNCARIFPDWQNQPQFSVVIVLQKSHLPMMEITPQVEQEKQQLREIFMRFGFELAFSLSDRGYPSDVIDPRTGYPLLSRSGEIPHDDTATVKALLHYPIIRNKCRVLIHPQWGVYVYPSILISIADPTLIKLLIKSIAPDYGWRQLTHETIA
ncbi:MAG: methylmalonic aciduria and homocystinuria type D protein [Richelia sp.]|nr:methylmalonic aciduria and homocystinuria type D protein [Richelia sp.]